MKHWEAMPFITTDEYQVDTYEDYLERMAGFGFDIMSAEEFALFIEDSRQAWFNAYPTGTAYRVHCLAGGAWDRPTNWGEFGTRDQAISFIVEKYRK